MRRHIPDESLYWPVYFWKSQTSQKYYDFLLPNLAPSPLLNYKAIYQLATLEYENFYLESYQYESLLPTALYRHNGQISLTKSHKTEILNDFRESNSEIYKYNELVIDCILECIKGLADIPGTVCGKKHGRFEGTKKSNFFIVFKTLNDKIFEGAGGGEKMDIFGSAI